MAEELDKKIKKQLLLIWKKFSAAFPVICFFLCLFVGILNVFGSQYVMIVSLVTVLFQVNYKKRNTLKSLLGISALQVVNKFFFPTSMGQQFCYNFQMIFHMQHMYLRILERSLTERLDHGVICDAQIQYHMLHEQVLEYLGKLSLKESDYYRQVLDITWKMMAEMGGQRLGTFSQCFIWCPYGYIYIKAPGISHLPRNISSP